jgi:hypothetical protein
MRWIGSGLLLLVLFGQTGCQLTREPKPPRPPEVLQAPPDEARYQSADKIYPNNVLNQDTNAKSRDTDAIKTGPRVPRSSAGIAPAGGSY